VRLPQWAASFIPGFHLSGEYRPLRRTAATETDARKIATMRKLLSEEEAKLAEWRAKNPKSNAAE